MKRTAHAVALLAIFSLAAVPASASSNDTNAAQYGIARAWVQVAYEGANREIWSTAQPGSCNPIGDPTRPTRVYSAALYGHAKTVLFYSRDHCLDDTLVATLNGSHKADSGIVTCRPSDPCEMTRLGKYGAIAYRAI